jgi:citrate synthase
MIDSGLAGVVVTETVLSHSDGARGILWVRGHTLPELAANFGYDGAVGLLWEGFAGDRLTRDRMQSSLGRARERAFARLAAWLDRAEQRPLAEGVRLALASLPEVARPPRSSAPSRSQSPHCCAAARATHHLLPNRRAPPRMICCA